MHEPAPGGLPTEVPEFTDPYTDLAIEGAARADTLSLVVIVIIASLLITSVIYVVWICR